MPSTQRVYQEHQALRRRRQQGNPFPGRRAGKLWISTPPGRSAARARSTARAQSCSCPSL
eukprot:9343217-Pyramimonas_sp.AAC.1